MRSRGNRPSKILSRTTRRTASFNIGLLPRGHDDAPISRACQQACPGEGAVIDAKLRANLADFLNLQARHPAAARSLLQKLIEGKIVFTPVTALDRAFYNLEWL